MKELDATELAYKNGYDEGYAQALTDMIYPVDKPEKEIDCPIIAVDFDGTLAENKWPLIGAPNMFLITWLILKKLDGASLILWTCRTGDLLEQAICFCNTFGLYFDAVNENLPESIELHGGSDSRKIFADIYIDDKNSHRFTLPFHLISCKY